MRNFKFGRESEEEPKFLDIPNINSYGINICVSPGLIIHRNTMDEFKNTIVKIPPKHALR